MLFAVAAWLRFTHLDLCEFKTDELKTLLVALRAVETGDWPLVGMPSSIGIDVGPTFYYVIAPPLLVGRSPILVSSWIALLGTLAVVMLYGTLRPRFGPFVALTATALAATAPWAVLHARKIWAPDVLLVFAVALLHCLFAVVERPRTWWLLAVPLLAVTLGQLHLSAVPLVVTAVVVVGWRWRTVNWTALVVGVLLALVTMTPYLVHLVRSGWADVRSLSQLASGGTTVARDPLPLVALRAVAYTFDAAGTGAWDYVTGASEPAFEAAVWPIDRLAGGAGWLVATAIIGGLISTVGRLVFRRRVIRRTPRFRTWRRDRLRLVLAVWLVVVWASMLAFRPHHMHPYYFLVTHAVSFALAAVALDDLRRVVPMPYRRTGTATLAALAGGAAAAYFAFTLLFLRFVADHGGTAGDYGVGFAHKRDAARYALCHGLEVLPENGAREIPSLMAYEREHGSTPTDCDGSKPADAGLLIVRSRLHDTRPFTCAGDEVRRFGPLEACVFRRPREKPRMPAAPAR